MSGLVVVGASYAGVQAALSARDAGYEGPVTIVTDEVWLPYQRPPLSKSFLAEQSAPEQLVMRDEAFFARKDITLLRGERVTAIERGERSVRFASGPGLRFDTLVLATGSRARRLEVPGAEADGVCYLRDLNDALSLRARLERAGEIVIVGGGFIGLEVAASAAKLGKRVSVLESAPRLLERAVPPMVSGFLLDLHRGHGAEIRLRASVAAIESRAGHVTAVRCGDGSLLPADLVLVGIGGIANDELARHIGLACANGIVVDGEGRSGDPAIYAAGDCANHYNVFAEEWIRLESVQNAQDQAKAAGLSIAGRSMPYRDVPRFWSDQYDVKLQTVGISRGFDGIAVRGSPGDGQFSVFYYRADRLVAVDSINRPGEQMAARRLISEGLSPTPAEVSDLSFDLRSPTRVS